MFRTVWPQLRAAGSRPAVLRPYNGGIGTLTTSISRWLVPRKTFTSGAGGGKVGGIGTRTTATTGSPIVPLKTFTSRRGGGRDRGRGKDDVQKSWGKQMKDADPSSILQLFVDEGHRFSPRNLATALHRVAKRGGRSFRQDPRVAKLVDACLPRIDEFEAQHMANSIWAVAKAEIPATQLFDAIAEKAPKRIDEFNSQNMANAVWAFATAGVKAPQLFDAIAGEAVGRINEFNSQGMANTVWAFATAGVTAPPLLETIAVETVRRIRDLNAQDLANTIWAFACVGCSEINFSGSLDQLSWSDSTI